MSTHALGPYIYMYVFLCVCAHIMAHVCRSEHNLWELGALGKEPWESGESGSVHQACWQMPLPTEQPHQPRIPYLNQTVYCGISLGSSLYVLGTSPLQMLCRYVLILWVTSNLVASFPYSWPSDHKKPVSSSLGVFPFSSYITVGLNYQLALVIPALSGKRSLVQSAHEAVGSRPRAIFWKETQNAGGGTWCLHRDTPIQVSHAILHDSLTRTAKKEARNQAPELACYKHFSGLGWATNLSTVIETERCTQNL